MQYNFANRVLLFSFTNCQAFVLKADNSEKSVFTKST